MFDRFWRGDQARDRNREGAGLGLAHRPLRLPDGELHEVGAVVSQIQRAGMEVRHVQSLREHYALTLRAWVRNLEAGWTTPWPRSARVARGSATVHGGSALNFEAGRTQVHQVLAVRLHRGRSGLPLRARFEAE
jgi:cyclopropane-fatty-acyl-phospholipid synthase